MPDIFPHLITLIYFLSLFLIISIIFHLISQLVKYFLAPLVVANPSHHPVFRLALAALFPTDETLFSSVIAEEEEEDGEFCDTPLHNSLLTTSTTATNTNTTARYRTAASTHLRRQTSTFHMQSPTRQQQHQRRHSSSVMRRYKERQNRIHRVAEFVLAASWSCAFVLPSHLLTSNFYYMIILAAFCACSVRYVMPIAKLTRTLALRASRNDNTHHDSAASTSEDDDDDAIKTGFDPSMRTAALALGGVLQSLVWLLWIYFVCSVFLDLDLSGLRTGFGIGGVLVAFSLQKTVESVFGTFAILMVRPFVVGDRITLQTGEAGTVETIGLRATEIRLVADGEILIVPNNELASTRIRNRTRCDNRRVEIRFEIDPSTLPAQKLGNTRLLFERAIRQAPNLARIDKVVLANAQGLWGGYVFEAVFFVIGNETSVVRDTKSVAIENVMMVCGENGIRLAGPAAHLCRGAE